MSVKKLNKVTVDAMRDMHAVKGYSIEEVVNHIHKEVGIQRDLLVDAMDDIRHEPGVKEAHEAIVAQLQKEAAAKAVATAPAK